MQKLGFSKIHIAKTGKDGIDIFKECISSEITPLIFLDYNLPDMEGLSVIEQILDIRPETKVILETSREKNDEKATSEKNTGTLQGQSVFVSGMIESKKGMRHRFSDVWHPLSF